MTESLRVLRGSPGALFPTCTSTCTGLGSLAALSRPKDHKVTERCTGSALQQRHGVRNQLRISPLFPIQGTQQTPPAGIPTIVIVQLRISPMTGRIPDCDPYRPRVDRYQDRFRPTKHSEFLEEAVSPHSVLVRDEARIELTLRRDLTNSLKTASNVAEGRKLGLRAASVVNGWGEKSIFPKSRPCRLSNGFILQRHSYARAARNPLVLRYGSRQCQFELFRPFSETGCLQRSNRLATFKNGLSPSTAFRREKLFARAIQLGVLTTRHPRILQQRSLLPSRPPMRGERQPRPLQAQQARASQTRSEPTGVRETSTPEFPRVKQGHCRPPHLANEMMVDGQEPPGYGRVEASSLELGEARCCRRRKRDVSRDSGTAGKGCRASNERAEREVYRHADSDHLARPFKIAARLALQARLVLSSKEGWKGRVAETTYTAPPPPSGQTPDAVRNLLRFDPERSLSQYKGGCGAEAFQAICLAAGERDQLFVAIGFSRRDCGDEIVASGNRRSNSDLDYSHGGAGHVRNSQIVQVEQRPRQWQAHHAAPDGDDLRRLPCLVQAVVLLYRSQSWVTNGDRTEEVTTEQAERGIGCGSQSIAETVPERPTDAERHQVSRCCEVRREELGSGSAHKAMSQIVVEAVQGLGVRACTRQVNPSVAFQKRPDRLSASIARHHGPRRRFRDHARLHPQFQDGSRDHGDGRTFHAAVPCGFNRTIGQQLKVIPLVARRGKEDVVAIEVEALFLEQQVPQHLAVINETRKLSKLRQLTAISCTYRRGGGAGERRCRALSGTSSRCQPITRPSLCPEAQVYLRFLGHHRGGCQGVAVLPQGGNRHSRCSHWHRTTDSCQLRQRSASRVRVHDAGLNKACFEPFNGEAARRVGTSVAKGAGAAVVRVLLYLLTGPFGPGADKGARQPLVEHLDGSLGGALGGDRLLSQFSLSHVQPLLLQGRHKGEQSQTPDIPCSLSLPLKRVRLGSHSFAWLASNMATGRGQRRFWNSVGTYYRPLSELRRGANRRRSDRLDGGCNSGGIWLCTSSRKYHDLR
nr:hypothetical protein [Culex narnavirus 1]